MRKFNLEIERPKEMRVCYSLIHSDSLYSHYNEQEQIWVVLGEYIQILAIKLANLVHNLGSQRI